MFVDLFDSLGTLMSCSKEMGLVNEKGEIKNLGRMLYTDAASTIIGASIGTSTVTAYVESAAGIVAGARTGLAALALLISKLAGALAARATGMCGCGKRVEAAAQATPLLQCARLWRGILPAALPAAWTRLYRA